MFHKLLHNAAKSSIGPVPRTAPRQVEEYYQNPFPALPVFNKPKYTAEEEKEDKEEGPLPQDEWNYKIACRQPKVEKMAPVFERRRDAWKATNWVPCVQFL